MEIAISALAVVATGVWLLFKPAYDSFVAFLGALATFAGLIIRRKRRTSSRMNQTVGDNSIAIQSGGNLTIGNVTKEDKHGR